MGIMFGAIERNYEIAMQYKYTLNTLKNFGQLHDKRIWRNFTYFIDWMERNLPKEKFFKVMGKSYDLEDSILFRIEKPEDKNSSGKDDDAGKQKDIQTWLMSNVFRHVENPHIEKDPLNKYVGKVKFTKLIAGTYEGEIKPWTPPEKNDEDEDIGHRKPVDDIRIVVYEDDDMIHERLYEKEYGWKDEWVNERFHENIPAETDRSRYDEYEKFLAFKKKWIELKNKMKVPGWYHFNPSDPKNRGDNHNMMKDWDPKMFSFLEKQKWNVRINDQCAQGQYQEKSEFVVDCSQLLGIGGEAVVIRKLVAEKVGINIESKHDQKYEALKIIPIMRQNFENEYKLQEMKKKVNAQHDKADPENFFFVDYQSKANFADTFLKAAETVGMTDQDVELAENHATEFKHDSLIEYSNIQLDFIKVFGKKVFVMVIGKLNENLIHNIIFHMYTI